MNKIEFYRCFSPNLNKFITSCGKKSMYIAQHENGKTFHVYKMDEELSAILKAWSNNNPNKK